MDNLITFYLIVDQFFPVNGFGAAADHIFDGDLTIENIEKQAARFNTQLKITATLPADYDLAFVVSKMQDLDFTANHDQDLNLTFTHIAA